MFAAAYLGALLLPGLVHVKAAVHIVLLIYIQILLPVNTQLEMLSHWYCGKTKMLLEYCHQVCNKAGLMRLGRLG